VFVIAPRTAVSAVRLATLALPANNRGPGYEPGSIAGLSLGCGSHEE
jgi:hypothetical protein